MIAEIKTLFLERSQTQGITLNKLGERLSMLERRVWYASGIAGVGALGLGIVLHIWGLR